MLNWLDITQIVLLLAACYACFLWGKFNGIDAAVSLLLEKRIITETDLEKLND
jgi:hypothetical protein